MSEEDEEDEIHHEAERIERTLRISESYNINGKANFTLCRKRIIVNFFTFLICICVNSTCISTFYWIPAKSLDSLSQGSCTSSSGIKGDGGSSCNDGDVDDEDDDRTTTSNTDAGDTDGAASFSAGENLQL